MFAASAVKSISGRMAVKTTSSMASGWKISAIVRHPLHGQLHGLGQDLHVEAGGGGHAGPLHLEDDLLPVVLHRPVDLGNRRRPERHVGVDLREPVMPVGAEVLDEDGLELRERPDHHLLVQVLEGVDDGLGDEVGPG